MLNHMSLLNRRRNRKSMHRGTRRSRRRPSACIDHGTRVTKPRVTYFVFYNSPQKCHRRLIRNFMDVQILCRSFKLKALTDFFNSSVSYSEHQAERERRRSKEQRHLLSPKTRLDSNEPSSKSCSRSPSEERRRDRTPQVNNVRTMDK